MTREILFRGKRFDNNEWAYGYLLGDTASIYEFGIQTRDEKYYAIVEETIGQYTGLLDKNNKKVFEGDILRIAKCSDPIGTYFFPPLPYPVPVVVKWDFCAWLWETLTAPEKYYLDFPQAWCHYECEVIGNIHDNPNFNAVEQQLEE